MFDLGQPWWEFIVRGAVVYCVLLLIIRMSGKRTVGQFTPFDLLVVMLLSEAVSGSLTGGEESVTGGLIVACTLVALNMVAAVLSSRSRRMADILDGSSVLLGRNGKIYHEVVKKSRLSDSEVEQALREADCKLEEMECIFLEADGKITVQTKR